MGSIIDEDGDLKRTTPQRLLARPQPREDAITKRFDITANEDSLTILAISIAVKPSSWIGTLVNIVIHIFSDAVEECRRRVTTGEPS